MNLSGLRLDSKYVSHSLQSCTLPSTSTLARNTVIPSEQLESASTEATAFRLWNGVSHRTNKA